MPYTVVLLGLGQVGFQYDENEPLNSPLRLSHAASFFHDKRFQLVGAVERDPDVRKRFSNKYGVPAYSTLEELSEVFLKIDVCVIATPTHTHMEILKKITSFSPAVVICEKPITENLQEMEVFLATGIEKMSVIVNYFRSFSPALKRLQSVLHQGTYGEVMNAQVYYCRGFLNNATHFLDVLAFLFGKIKHISSTHFYGYFKAEDVNIDACVQLESGLRVQCHFVPETYFFSGRIYIYTQKGILLIDESGQVSHAEVIQSGFGDQIPGFFVKIDQIGFEQPFVGLLDEAVSMLQGKTQSGDSLMRSWAMLECYTQMKEELDNAGD